jgi:MFS transporter, DHA2 family, multidrug resistance protein
VSDPPLGSARKWTITFSVMLVTVMQVLDTSITNVALPHMQGALSASVEEMAWVVTSYLAANAMVIPATGWLTARFGRRRFYLMCTVTFTASSFLSGIAPNLEFLVLMRVLQGIGGGPVIPMAQAIMWEIFPLEQRGTAVAVWGLGIMMAPIFGPTLGGYLADNWSWRWIFYINLPIGILAFFMVSTFLFDSPHVRRPRGIDALGLVLMLAGFGCLQLMLDLGERRDWFDSGLIVALAVAAVVALTAFAARELTAPEPILDLNVFNDRNFALGTAAIFLIGLGFNSSLLLLALYTQKILGYDAWTSGLTLAPGGLGTMLALLISGRLVSRLDQRAMLAFGCLLQAVALWHMTHLSPTMDYWSLAAPRFVQGFSQGFIFVPLQALALATVTTPQLPNATAAFNVVRNIGGSVGVALATTMLSRRSQAHQATLVTHVNVWNPEVAARLQGWTDHFLAHGDDSFTAGRRALAMLYRETVVQAQILAYADDFWMLLAAYCAVVLLVPFMRRVRPAPPPGGRSEESPEPAGQDQGAPVPTRRTPSAEVP